MPVLLKIPGTSVHTEMKRVLAVLGLLTFSYLLGISMLFVAISGASQLWGLLE
jgi:hypothetical protein